MTRAGGDGYPKIEKPTVESMEKALDIAMLTGDSTVMRTIGAWLLAQRDPDAKGRVVGVSGEGDNLTKEMANGDIWHSDDGGKTWWIGYSASSDLHYEGPDDPVGYYMP